MELEARLLAAAASAGVPVPGVVAASDDDEALGAAYMILERVDGEAIPRRILRDPEFEQARPQLVGQATAALARIHTIDPGSVPGLETTDPLEAWKLVLHGLGEPHPAFEIAFRWLEANRPPLRRPRLVHGDFRLGNLMVGPDGLRAVLDWELAHAGDPAEDLGWMCVRAWRFGSDLPALGLGTYEELLDAYAAVAAPGDAVDADALSWWETFGTLRWGVMCVLMASQGLASGHLSVELAAIGRRACENEWDVLSCLARAGLTGSGGDYAPSADLEAPAGLHDRPTAAELASTVGRWLSETVTSSGSGRIGFDARIAANVLAIVERELEHAAEDAASHSALLSALGVTSELELADSLRTGSVAWDAPEVITAVRWTVRAKVRVARPGYAEDVVAERG
jgi:aminoglycoside phosphotransferase (APT) family kinase protein